MSDAGGDAGGDAGPDVPPVAACAEYVVLDPSSGRLELDGQPYRLKGINLHMQIGAVVTNACEPDLTPADCDWS